MAKFPAADCALYNQYSTESDDKNGNADDNDNDDGNADVTTSAAAVVAVAVVVASNSEASSMAKNDKWSVVVVEVVLDVLAVE